ncbi:hypothetical protein H0X48_04055 [Candidatus Dependentiae bacterium]|nr:hypothetical protein [Candidatus Dependentiae bacterium]
MISFTFHRLTVLSTLVCSLLLSVGCARYRATSLPKLMSDCSPAARPSEQQPITFMYKALTPRECKLYLDRDVIKAGYQPLHITIVNNSPRYLYFSQQAISLPCATASEVAQKVHTSTVTRALAYGLPALIVPPLAIPAIVDSAKSAEANRQLDSDFALKTVDDCIIKPYSSLNGLIFIPCNAFRNNFIITLVDQATGEKLDFAS